ncbi:hypothetical protein Tco_0643752 [Tanacetum coccineum]
MDDTQLIEADLVVDYENILIETEIQDVDDIDVDKDAKEDFVATPGEHWLFFGAHGHLITLSVEWHSGDGLPGLMCCVHIRVGSVGGFRCGWEGVQGLFFWDGHCWKCFVSFHRSMKFVGVLDCSIWMEFCGFGEMVGV